MTLEEQLQHTHLASSRITGPVNLLHLLACYPIRDRLLFYSSTRAIIALSRTCKPLSRTYQDLLQTQWKIDSKLSRFVADPQRLRLQLRHSKAVISGSFALQYFDRVTYHDSDLDIFVEYGDHVDENLAVYLTSAEGYQLAYTRASPQSTETDNGLDPSREEAVYPIRKICQVRTYTKRSAQALSDLKIQIIETLMMPIASILSGFYATHVVNVITWSTAYAIFPVPTFMQHKGYMLEPLSNKFIRSILRKWGTRGWEFDQTLWPEEETDTHSFQPRRRVGDRYTWKISFDRANFDCSQGIAADDDGIQNNVFEMNQRKATSDDAEGIIPHYKINIDQSSLRSSVLRHEYVAPKSWKDFLAARLNRATRMQIVTKLDPVDWPEGVMDIDGFNRVHGIGFTFWDLRYLNRAKNWRYHDEDMGRWYDAWNQERRSIEL